MGEPVAAPGPSKFSGWEGPNEYGSYYPYQDGVEVIEFKTGEDLTSMPVELLQVGPDRWVWGHSCRFKGRGDSGPPTERNLATSREEALDGALAYLRRFAQEYADQAETETDTRIAIEYLKLIESHRNQGRLF